MIVNAAVQELISLRPGDEIVSCDSEDYYNSSSPQYKEVCDIVRESGKLIMLTRWVKNMMLMDFLGEVK